jgi:hypothetical protein
MAMNSLTVVWFVICLISFCIANSLGVAAIHEVRHGWPFHFITTDPFVVMKDGSVVIASVFHFLDGSTINDFRWHALLCNCIIATICIIGSSVAVEQYCRTCIAKCQLTLRSTLVIISSMCLFLAAHHQWAIGVSQTAIHIYVAQLLGAALWVVFLAITLTMLAAVMWTV